MHVHLPNINFLSITSLGRRTGKEYRWYENTALTFQHLSRVTKILKMLKGGEHEKAQKGTLSPSRPPAAEIVYFPNSPETNHDPATIARWLNLADKVLTTTMCRKTAGRKHHPEIQEFRGQRMVLHSRFRTSDHVTREGAERELSHFDCITAGRRESIPSRRLNPAKLSSSGMQDLCTYGLIAPLTYPCSTNQQVDRSDYSAKSHRQEQKVEPVPVLPVV